MQRVRERLKIVLPVTLFLIFILLYMNTKSAVKALIVMLAVPFSLIGAVWYLWLLGYHISIAVWVGMIALMGLDAETGVFMLLFLDLSYNDAVRKGKMRQLRRPARGDHPRGGQTGAAEGHDRHGRDDGPAADHVVDGHRRRHDETHRRADDRRAGHELPDGTARLSRDLRPVEMAGRSAAYFASLAFSFARYLSGSFLIVASHPGQQRNTVCPLTVILTGLPWRQAIRR